MTVRDWAQRGGGWHRGGYRWRRPQEMTGWGMRTHRGDGETLWDMGWESERDIRLDKTGEKKERPQTEWRKQMKNTTLTENALTVMLCRVCDEVGSEVELGGMVLLKKTSQPLYCGFSLLCVPQFIFCVFSPNVFTSLFMPLWELLETSRRKTTMFSERKVNSEKSSLREK